MTEDDLVDKWQSAKAMMAAAGERIAELEAHISRARSQVQEAMTLEAEKAMFSRFNQDLVRDFFKEPYVTIPKRAQEWYVVAPKFVDFQIGWLDKSSKSFNVFLVNKYMHWLAQIPAGLREQFDFRPELPVQVYDGTVFTGTEHQGEVWDRYQKFLLKRQGKDRILIRRGREFHLIAAMIEDGTLPFRPQPVSEEDLREPAWNEPITLRDYQQEAWDRFLETGALGVFWPFSAGKTYLGLWAAAHLRGSHLVIVPTVTLKEQWEERIQQYLGPALPQREIRRALKAQLQEWCRTHGLSDGGTAAELRARLTEKFGEGPDITVATYHAYESVRSEEWGLVVFDECHRLPADTFSRMATMRASYRMGLSGTPYREDGRTDYIFALTGFPVGMDWHRLLEQEVFKKPDITLYVLDDRGRKLRKLEELLRDPVKTIVFCDSIELGKRIAAQHNIPHVHGDTTNRMQILREALVAVVSRVGDEGISLPDIRRVIEVDFLYGSRRQEAQRMGRLFHGREPGEHIILMSEQELELYEKRLLAIYERGWNVKIVR